MVALLFIIFDVEVAFFFPWATVYGKATHLMDPNLTVVQSAASAKSTTVPGNELTPAAAGIYRELSIPLAAAPKTTDEIRNSSTQLAQIALIDILAFFAILMVGFAYVWRRGDLDWVRATNEERPAFNRPPPTTALEREPVLSA